jgi:hypothetical protein
MKTLLRLLLVCTPFLSQGQSTLRPGFDASEYLDMLAINASWPDSNGTLKRYRDINYQQQFFSEEVGLRNRWGFWTSPGGIGVISIRGTVMKLESWLANVYCPMVPAAGSLHLNDSTDFKYQFAEDPKAAVHLGYAIATAFLAPQVVQAIKEQYAAGNMRAFIIIGHSQGGGIAYLMTSYLRYLQKSGGLPADITFKTYCSAAPKPGNLYYAYDYEFLTRNGWSHTVVNAADWVPEAAPTAQTLSDFNPVNPFLNIGPMLSKQKWPANWYLKNIYRKMNRAVNGSRDKLQKYLGGTVGKLVHKTFPQYREPEYANTMNYMRAGPFIVLQPDSVYQRKFPEVAGAIWTNHMFEPYEFLVRRQYMDADKPQVQPGN